MRIALLSVLLLAACASDSTPSLDDEWGMDGPLFPTPAPGKEDSMYRRGLLVNTDTTRTQVWSARNKWEDRETPAAQAAGIVWPANSGLTWDEKYVKWIDAMAFIPSVDGWSMTIELTTPWGKTLPSPMLECAEMSLFLRVTFAAWYELPLFFESIDSGGSRVFFGHNGVRTASGRYAQSPEFAIRYRDYTADGASPWPSDSALRNKRIAGGEDLQPELGPDLHFGAYLDEVHLNKRAGYFTVMVLDYFGSMNLADSANAYNLKPEAVRSGDIQLERWQRNGIGHTLVVKSVAPLPGGSLDVTTISGSMPRRQGVRQSGQSSKSYFTSETAGGEGSNSDGDEYAKLGGGLKRYRVAKNIDGYWTNTWMSGDEANWINSTSYAQIAARPGRFEQILGQVSPEQQRTELLQQIADARRHISQYPASCSARENRERAFATLYELSERAWQQTPAQVDTAYRQLEDYVFNELEYSRSKTCCWNSSTSAMYDIIMDKARADAGTGTCTTPTVFKSRSDGYKVWKDHAAALGRAADWREWTEDESCSQRDVPSDTDGAPPATPFCELDTTPTPTCTDSLEPNNSQAAAKAATGTVSGLKVCAGDDDWIKASGTVKIDFTHSAGDLDIEAYDAAGTKVGASAGTSNTETVTVPAGGFVHIFGYSGAQNSYTLTAP